MEDAFPIFFKTLSRTGGSGKDQGAIEDVERGDRGDGRDQAGLDGLVRKRGGPRRIVMDRLFSLSKRRILLISETEKAKLHMPINNSNHASGSGAVTLFT